MNRTDISLRIATPNDLPLLQYWDEQPHNIESDPNDDWEWETELYRSPEWREFLIGEVNGRPVGFMQIIDPETEETHYWGDVGPGFRAIDIWMGEAADMGKGYGTIMMQMAFERCFAHPDVQAILIDPLVTNVRAQQFYQRLGFEFVEFRTFNLDDCAVYRLDRNKWESLKNKSL